MRYLWNLLVIPLLFLGCTKKTDNAKIQIQLPEAYSSKVGALTVGAGTIPSDFEGEEDSPWEGSIASYQALNCYAVFVGGPGAQQSSCEAIQGTTTSVIYFGSYVGGVPSGQSLEIEVPPGPDKTITLIGMHAQSGACKDFHGNGPEEGMLSHPRVLASQTLNLTPGDTVLNMSVPADLTSLPQIDKCDVDDGGGGPNLDLASILDRSGFHSSSRAGYSVDSFGNKIVVGAPDQPGGNERAYVYELKDNAWTRYDLPAGAGGTSDYYGTAVATNGIMIAVGAKSEDVSPNANSGAVYIYYFDSLSGSWIEGQKITQQSPSDNDHFGHSIAMKGNKMVIGTNRAFDDQGFVEYYKFDTSSFQWVHKQTLPSPSSGSHYQFGYSVALSHDYLMIGEPDYDAGNDVGKAYIIKYDPALERWDSGSIQSISTGITSGRLGTSVAIHGTKAFVSAPGEVEGKVYEYEMGAGGSWTSAGSPYSGEDSGDQFGISIDAGKDGLLVGAMTAGGNAEGRAYFYRFEGDGLNATPTIIEPLEAYVTTGDFGFSVTISPGILGVGDYKRNSYEGGSYAFPVPQ